MRRQRVEFVELAVPSPFALPLMVERFREKLSTEKLKDRLDRMLKAMEKEAVRVEEADAIVVRRTPARRRAR
jgi:ATP-dependent Lhr-like helicase